MALRKTLSWMLMLIVAGAAGAGGVAWKLYHESNQIARTEIERLLREKFPDWELPFDEVAIDPFGTVQLTDVVLRPRGSRADLLHVPEITISIDRKLFAEAQILHVERLVLSEPTVWVTRDESGRWNWQELAPPPKSDEACPEIEIIRGTIVVHSARSQQLPETQFSCRSVNGSLTPSGHRRYAVRAQTDVDHAGKLALTGSVDLKSKAWSLVGDIAALDTEQGLLGVAAGLSPDLREQMTALSEGEGVERFASGPRQAPMRSAHADPFLAQESATVVAEVPESPQFALPELGVQMQLDLHFELGSAGTESALQYVVAATIHDGQIVNAALPAPLYNLQALIQASNTEIVVQDLTATNEDSRLWINGRMERSGGSWKKDFSVQAMNLELGRQVRQYLHNDAWLKMYNQIQPAGRFNLDVHVVHDGADDWDVTLKECTAIECSLLHELFQYPITGVSGAVRQEGETFQAELQGMAGDRPVTLNGYFRNPGPDIEASFRIQATNVPLDQRVIDALALEKYDAVREALEVLRLEGLADVDGTLSRAGAGQKFALKLHVDVHDGVLDYMRFPYRLTNFSGTVDYDPEVAPVWRFQNLRGEHKGALLTGTATYDLHQPPGRLDLRVTALKAALDQDLYRACITATPDLGKLWEELSPSGLIDVRDIAVVWAPGAPPTIELPSVQLTSGRLTPAALPYPWHDVTGTFAWRNGVAMIHSLSGYHGETYAEITRGSGSEAYVEIEPRAGVAWHMHLDDIRLRRVVFDDELRQALPQGMATVATSLDPRGPIDIDLGVDLKGISAAELGPEMVTAHWGLRAHFNNNDIFAGVELKNVTGNVEIVDGIWDGTAVTADGYVELSSARAHNIPMQGVHGPFSIDDNQVTVGTPDFGSEEWRQWLRGPVMHSAENRYAARQMEVDNLYGDENHQGRLGMSGVVLVGPDAARTQYRMDLNLRDASLRAWARDQKLAAGQLKGAVNGQLRLVGNGSSSHATRGDGWIQVSPAELYELPVFAQIFALPSFKPVNRAAFNYAYGEFTLHDGLVDFSGIKLVGDALQLRGRGTAEYADDLPGRLRIDFFSQADERFLGGISQIPLLGPLFDNWVHVVVRGTLDQPQVSTQAGDIGEFGRGIVDDIGRLTMPFAPPAMQAPPRGR